MSIKPAAAQTEVFTIKNSKTEEDENVLPEQIVRTSDVVSVEMYVPDTGVLVFYRFKRMRGCWYLDLISDRST
ncbi:hypothetical protein CWS35_10980 [Bradyrhizobium sp. SK17]|nr:hypothetical protein CWS35_10980 [Bradyrhizobium sp. SK17]